MNAATAIEKITYVNQKRRKFVLNEVLRIDTEKMCWYFPKTKDSKLLFDSDTKSGETNV